MNGPYCDECDEEMADGHLDSCSVPNWKPIKISETMRLELVAGVEGPSIYLNDERIAGPKPWGGGRITKSYQIKRAQLREILNRG